MKTGRGMNQARSPTVLVSVIIPVYNNALGLAACLQSLRAQSLDRSRFDVLIVDNGSTDDLRSLKETFGDYIWLSEASPGAYAARNRGLLHASSEFVAFTDADCIPDREWLESGLSALAGFPHGIVGGRVEMIPPVARGLNIMELCESEIFIMSNHAEVIDRWRFAVTANCFTRLSMFSLFGLFEGTLKSGGDREWSQRALHGGATLHYCDAAIVRHPRRSTFTQLSRKVRRLKGGIVEIAKRQRSWSQFHHYVRYTAFDHRLWKVLFSARNSLLTEISLAVVILALMSVGFWETVRVTLGGDAYRGED